MAHTIAFAFNKGGVGKTTSAVSLAVSLQRMGYKILFIDMDPQANSTMNFGFSNKGNLKHVGRMMLGEFPIQDIILQSRGIDILPASDEMFDKQREIGSKHLSHTFLNDYLDAIRDQYDFVILDCPPSLEALTVNALVAADQVICPLILESFDMKGIEKMIQTLLDIRKKVNPNLNFMGFIVCKSSAIMQTKLGKLNLEDLEATFPDKVLRPLIRTAVTVPESQNEGMTIFEWAAESKPALDYDQLAKNILQILNVTSHEQSLQTNTHA
ncbi:ParA family protein [Cytophagaceae bacterium DM2B3-1]|uniref:ParA family protein n=2 Tax=Xanthocytophaga TaxID=3078918 RepID=A0AAE3R123_9BACT|nr:MULTISPECIES: ParA family protein [Xanthocytophaga]MDJ1486399.1 ParA family protein [Xanthocytophaga flavus]MDJ1498284.1 ParA family protein [Xanthocytophaga flavus]MDJ1505263.1 ParA family protein [Xanthocytophaga agilis]